MPTSLADLPSDVLALIIERAAQGLDGTAWGSPDDLARCRLVCRDLMRVANELPDTQVVPYFGRAHQGQAADVRSMLARIQNLRVLRFRNCNLASLGPIFHRSDCDDDCDAVPGSSSSSIMTSGLRKLVFVNGYGLAPRYLLHQSPRHHQLGTFSSLRAVTLQACHEIMHLPILPQGVTTVRISRCTNLANVSCALGLCSAGLRRLVVEDCPGLCTTDRQLVLSVAAMTCLKKLVLRNVGTVSWQGQARGVFPPSLQHLHLTSCAKSWTFIDAFRDCRAMRLLRLSFLYNTISTSSLAGITWNSGAVDSTFPSALACMPRLEHVSVDGVCVTVLADDSTSNALPMLRSLRATLAPTDSGPDAHGLHRVLSTCAALRTLDLDLGMRVLSLPGLAEACSRLKEISLRMGHIDGLSAATLARFPALRRLSLWACDCLAGATTLELPDHIRDVVLAETSFHELRLPASLKSLTLTNNMALRRIRYKDGSVGDGSLASLTVTGCALLQDLDFLDDSAAQLHVANCRSLTRLPRVVRLSGALSLLTLCHLPGVDWSQVRISDRVESVKLVGANITDLECLRHARGLSRLHVTTTSSLDISKIGACENLEEVRIQCNHIIAWSALSELPRVRLIVLVGNIPVHLARRIKTLLPEAFLYIVRKESLRLDQLGAPPLALTAGHAEGEEELGGGGGGHPAGDDGAMLLLQDDQSHELLPPSDG